MRRAALVLLSSLALLAGCSGTPTPEPGAEAAPVSTTTRPRPTPTPARTTTPPPAPAAQTFQGSGDDVVSLSPPVELGVVVFECPGCDGNVVVETADDLLVNEIGAYSGKRLIGARGESTSTIEVRADGAWTMSVGGLDDRIEQYVSARPAQGSGDDVFFLASAPSVVALAHDGDRNFSVLSVGVSGSPQLVVNEIGAYTGRVALDAAGGPVVVEVTADGDWSITP